MRHITVPDEVPLCRRTKCQVIMQDIAVKTIDGWLRSGLTSGQLQKLVRERSFKLSTATKQLQNRTYEGFGFSEDFKNMHGLTDGLTLGQASESPQLILGLAAASSNLGYANVPEFVDYEIRVSGGLESVVW